MKSKTKPEPGAWAWPHPILSEYTGFCYCCSLLLYHSDPGVCLVVNRINRLIALSWFCGWCAFLISGNVCLVNSYTEWDSGMLTSCVIPEGSASPHQLLSGTSCVQQPAQSPFITGIGDWNYSSWMRSSQV